MARTSKKWLKRCRKSLSAEECKDMQRSERRSRGVGTLKAPKIKACKKSDRGVKATVSTIHRLHDRAMEGDGSGAEDRFDYAAQDLRRGLVTRCGARFTRKALKIKVR